VTRYGRREKTGDGTSALVVAIDDDDDDDTFSDDTSPWQL
jgi:hypothetical protein